MATKGKDRSDQSIRYNSLSAISFPYKSATINQASTTVVAGIALPFAYKVYAVTVTSDAVVATTSFNLVIGTAAESTQVAKDASDGGTGYTSNAAGTFMFTADQTLGVTASLATQTFYPSVFDALYPANTLLTLRWVTNGTGTSTNTLVSVFYVPFDINVSKPTTLAFLPSTDL